MCGLAALFQPGRMFSPDILAGIDNDLYHRGPDSGGMETAPGMALVFRRLSILDVSESADQPMRHASGRYSLVFNGEIYNYKSLRRELESLGVRFRTTGDTEVVLEGFAKWGELVVDRLEGMYAFVIVDHKRQQVTAARDPLGIKPLYVLHRDNFVGFASEMRPLCRFHEATPDPDAIAELLYFRFAAGELSNLKGIERLPGGTIARFDMKTGHYQIHRRINVLDTFQPDSAMDINAALEMTENIIRDSVSDHLASDVGYAVQLSGGIDSSLITVLTSEMSEKPVRSFGISLGESVHDEKEFRQTVINIAKTDHHEIPINGHDFANALPRAIRHIEGPSPHLGCVLLMLLCDEIAKHSKVVLTGEGADEVFGGYQRYEVWKTTARYEKFAHLVPSFLWPFLGPYRDLERYCKYDPAAFPSVINDYRSLNDVFPALLPKSNARKVASGRFKNFYDRLMAVDQTAYLESVLLRQDKVAMAASVEARVPFAHYPLFQKINRIPQPIRIPGGITKPLLKKFSESYFPASFVHRRKVGLTQPLDEWMADETGLGRYLCYLTDSDSQLVQYAERNNLISIIERFRHGEKFLARILTQLINLELWLRSVKEMPRMTSANPH